MSSLKRRNKEPLASDEEEEEEGSLVKRPRVTRQVILDDECNNPQNQPLEFVPFYLADELEDVSLEILEEEAANPTMDHPSSPV